MTNNNNIIIEDFIIDLFVDIINDWDYVIDTDGVDMSISFNGMTDMISRKLQINELTLRNKIKERINEAPGTILGKRSIILRANRAAVDYSI